MDFLSLSQAMISHSWFKSSTTQKLGFLSYACHSDWFLHLYQSDKAPDNDELKFQPPGSRCVSKMATEPSTVRNSFSHFLKNWVSWVMTLLKQGSDMLKTLIFFHWNTILIRKNEYFIYFFYFNIPLFFRKVTMKKKINLRKSEKKNSVKSCMHIIIFLN